MDRLLSITENALIPGGNDHTDSIVVVFEAAYYELTGLTLEDRNITIEIVSDEDYDTMKPSKPQFEDSAGFNEGVMGMDGAMRRSNIVTTGERSIVDVLGGVGHEMGHVKDAAERGTLKQPYELPSGCENNYRGFRETVARQFEVATIRKIQEYTNINLTEFSDTGENRRRIERRLKWVGGSRYGFMNILSWLALVDAPDHPDAEGFDPALKRLKDQLGANKMLSANELIELSDHFIQIPLPERCSYVFDKKSMLPLYLHTIQEMAKSRLARYMTEPDGLDGLQKYVP